MATAQQLRKLSFSLPRHLLTTTRYYRATMIFPSRFQSSCALLLLVCTVSHVGASSLRDQANLTNRTDLATPGRILSNGGFPAPYYAGGCLPDIFKDKCKSCMCLKGGIGHPQTKRCLIIDVAPDGSGNNGCVDKAPRGRNCQHDWDCQGNHCGSFFQLSWARCS